jgi:electron transport complex protein RnfG
MTKYRTYFVKTILPVLFISLLMILIIHLVYDHTKKPIEDAKKNAEIKKIQSVLPVFDNDPIDSAKTFNDLVFYTAMKGDSIVGYACKTFTEKGFNGKFSLLIGFLPDGKIYKTAIIEQKETPGFGDRMKSGWKDQFNGKDLAKFNLKVKKDSGDVDAISGSTISSRAYCDAIEKAYLSLMKNILKKGDVKLASDVNDVYVMKDISFIKKVLPAFDNDPLKEAKSIEGIEYYTATKNKKPAGYAVKSSAKGYGGTLWILTGILPEGKIYDICILQNKETVGYGDKLNTPQFLSQFKGKVIGKCRFEVKKDDGDIDAISGATISSRAFCEALGKAGVMFSQNISTVKEEVKKDSVEEAPQKPAVYTYTDNTVFKGIIPDFNNDPLKEFKSVNGLDVYTGKMNGAVTGYAITSFSKKGYGGKVVFLVGFSPNGTIINVIIVSTNETLKYTDILMEAEYPQQFFGKNPASFKLAIKEDGGNVDAVSGVTFTSRAFCDAVQKAYYSFLNIKK